MNTRGYKTGDRIWWRNEYRQEFRATVLRVHRPSGVLIVKIDNDELRHESLVDLDHAVMSKTWHLQGADR
jgi:hypothetical protein